MQPPLPALAAVYSLGARLSHPSFVVTYNFRFRPIDDKPIEKAACDAAENGGQPKQPKLIQGPTTQDERRPCASCWVDGDVGDGDPDEMNERQAQSDSDGRKPDWSLPVRRPHDDEQEHHGENELGQESGEKAVFSWRMIAVAIRREALRQIETGPSAGNGEEKVGGGDGAQDLSNNIGCNLPSRETSPAIRPKVTAGFKWQPEIWPMA